MTKTYSKALTRTILLLLALLSASALRAQVPVALSPVARQQFFSASGLPLAGGCVSTFNAGTTTPAATYVDVTGTFQNTNPITLDGGGFATIYLANQAYKIQVNAAPATGACSSINLGSLIWVQDQVNAYQTLSSITDFFFLGVTSDPAGVGGEFGYRTDIPCFRGFTTFWDCFAQLTAIQTLQNKTLIAPTITTPTISVGGTWVGSPTLTTPNISGVNAQTGASYTVAATDEQKLVTFANGGAVAVTLPQATTPGFGAGTVFHFKNIGSGTVTITPTTSTVDATTNVVLSGAPGGGINGAGVDVYSDGANYFTQRGFFTYTGAITPNHLASWNVAGVVQDAGLAIVPPAGVLISSTAPSIGSGFGTSATVVNANGTAAFTINVGGGGAANAGTINLPTAAHGWSCFANDITNPTVGGGISTKQTGGSTTTATFTGFNATPVATAWTANDILQVSCFGF